MIKTCTAPRPAALPAAALLLSLSAAARADTGVGVDTQLGNALNPNTIDTVPARDPEGLDIERDRRSPSGLLYPWPKLPPDTRTTRGGWVWSGQAELGGLAVGGDEDSAWFRQYKDLQTGPYLNNFWLRGNQPDQAMFFEGFGGAPGYRDQFFGASMGRYNDWQVDLFYNEIPHVYTDSYRPLWTGIGGGDLRLPTLTPGGRVDALTTQQDILGAIDSVEDTELSIVRRKGGFRIDKILSGPWRVYASYSKEHRDGARPFGAVFGGGGGGGNVEIPESIDYDTHEIRGGVHYTDALSALNLEAHVSMFRNNLDTMRFQNPLFITTNTILGITPQTFTHGIYDLYPDNDYYNVRAEYARSLPKLYRGRVTGVVSWSRMKQDDDLIAPSSYSLAGGSINGVPTDNVWNTPAALSRDSAEAEIDNLLLDFGLTLQPTAKLGVRGKVRYQSSDNKNDYIACNPLTGQWGRLLNDGSGGSFVVPNATPGNNPADTSPLAYDATGCNLAATRGLGLVPSSASVPIRSVPYEYSKLNLEIGGDYRITPGQLVDARLMREEYHREHRERDKTWEDSLKLGYVNRAFDFGTLRLHGLYGKRRGDDYDLNANDAFLSAFLGPEASALNSDVHSWLRAPYGFRKFDIADRNILSLDGRFQWVAAEALDIGLGVQYDDIEYPNSDWGRTDTQRLAGASLDVNWQPSAKLGLWGYYGYQQGRIQQHGVAPTFSFQGGGCLIGRGGATVASWRDYCSIVAPDNTLFPSALAWDLESRDRNHALGAGLFYDFGKARLELDYTYSSGTSEIDYGYDATGQGFTPQQLALIGSGMPDLTTSQQILNLSLLVPINESLAVRALYRYEQGSINDWHYDGVADNPVPAANAVYLDAGPQDYHASVVGLLLQVGF